MQDMMIQTLKCVLFQNVMVRQWARVGAGLGLAWLLLLLLLLSRPRPNTQHWMGFTGRPVVVESNRKLTQYFDKYFVVRPGGAPC